MFSLTVVYSPLTFTPLDKTLKNNADFSCILELLLRKFHKGITDSAPPYSSGKHLKIWDKQMLIRCLRNAVSQQNM